MSTVGNNTNTTNQVGTVAGKRKKILNIIGIVLCVLLLPILIINSILIVKGMVNEDEVPGIGGYMPLIVLTESMDPTIKAGDIIICKKVSPSDVKEEDVISFFDPEGNGTSVVTHRVYEVEYDEATGEYSFRTQGDNNDVEDRLAVPEENLVGVWTEVRFGLVGHIVLFTQSTWGLIVCIFLPIGALITYEFLRRKKQDAEKQSDIDTLMEELKALKEAQANMQAQAQASDVPQTSAPISTETPVPTETSVEPSDSNPDGE